MDDASATLWLCTGARVTERHLLSRVASLAAEGRADWRLLARPVRIVVPSRSLREHVASRLVAEQSALAGVKVQTLRALALEVLERAGAPSHSGGAAFPHLVREAVAAEPTLRAALETLDDGAGAVVGTVRDLFDAGLDAGLVEAATEAALGAGGASAARAAALVRVAGFVADRLEVLGLDTRTSVFSRAASALERGGEGLLPARAVFVHGFAEATARALDLLLALVRHCGASVWVDRPADPTDADVPDAGATFTERLVDRLAGVATVRELAEREAEAALSLVSAAASDAESRGVAERIRRLLDAGVSPERIGIVARTLAGRTFALPTQLARLGIPFSGATLRGGPNLLGRRLRALVELVASGPERTAERWLDAAGEALAPPSHRANLRSALHALGGARLADLARVRVPDVLDGQGEYPLPVRGGLVPRGDGEDAVAKRRKVAGARLEGLVAAAARTEALLAAWPAEAPVSVHAAALRALVDDALGFGSGEPAQRAVAGALEALADDLPDSLLLDRAGFARALESAAGSLGTPLLGGAGGGVQVLDATEARGRTFDHLFVVGLERDVFPRIVLEDPLLPDEARRALAAVLPDLPQKRAGFDEERYLFAQLLSASPDVELSYRHVDDEGKERNASTFVERLRWAGRAPETTPSSPPLWSRELAGALRPAYERALVAGLRSGRRGFAAALPRALAEARSELALPPLRDATALARARLAALESLEPENPFAGTLGPTFGFVGPVADRRDPRAQPPFVTAIEAMAWCPWRAFLERILRLEPAPDALEALPALDAATLGQVVHRGMEALLVDAGVPSHVEIGRLATPIRVAWPAPAALRALVRRVAAEELAGSGQDFPALVEILADRAVELLGEVGRSYFGEGGASVLGTEIEAAIPAPGDGSAGEIRLRADLVLPGAPGLHLVDLKTGKPVSTAKRETTRRSKLASAIASGTTLQAAAYARAGAGPGSYLFLDREKCEGEPRFVVEAGDRELSAAFDASVSALLDARRLGSFPPRLVDGKGNEPRTCSVCEMSDACLRGDTGARHRLARFLEREEAEGGDGASAALRAARRVLLLGTASEDSGSAEEEA